MLCRLSPFTLDDARRAQARLRAYDVPQRLLLAGMQVEREHCDVTRGDPTVTARIALAHLRERGDYYARLKSCVEG